jgi:hypothetical protein
MVSAEQLLGALDRERFNLIGKLAPPVIAPVGIPFGILVREHRALRLEHRLAYIVFRCDEDDLGKLALLLAFDRLVDLGVHFIEL